MNNTLLDTVAACSKDLMKFGFSVEEFASQRSQPLCLLV